MQRHWSDHELETYWSCSSDELKLIPHRDASSRLGVAASLKFFQLEGYFPSSFKDIPAAAIDYMAKQLDVEPNAIADYDWQGRTGKRYRGRLRTALGVHPATDDDFKAVEQWLREDSAPWDHDARHLQDAVHEWYRGRHIEPPTVGRIERLVRSTVRTHEAEICAGTAAKLLPSIRQAMDALIDSSIPSDEQNADEGSDWRNTTFSVLKTDPGRVSLKSVLHELEKLRQIEALELPDNLFAEIQPKILHQYRLRAAAEAPREVRLHPEPIRYTLLAAFCWQRRQEILDGLVDLLIQIVHRISVRAEKKVVDELLGDLQKVHGKTTLLFKMAEAALEQPNGVVREVLYPVVSEQTLSDLVKEYRSHGPTYRRHVCTILRASYSGHYRRMLPRLLDALDFRANTATHRPIMQALALIKANRDSGKQHFTVDGTVPIEGVIPPNWRELVMEQDPSGEIRVNRINYEISALHSLREGLRCKAIWVVGADRFRNPDDDLPADFATQRTHYYAALQQPESADDFVAGVRKAMEDSLSRLNDGLPKNPKVTLRAQGKNRIKLSPLEPQPEPANILRVKAELMSRWPMTSLLDVLKETDLRVGFSETLHSVASREMLDRTTLRPRLLRCLYGLGTNAGLKRVVAGYVAADARSEGPYGVLSAVDNRQDKRMLYEGLDHDPPHDDIDALLRRVQTAVGKHNLVRKGITTDGAARSPAPIRTVFGAVPPQLWPFHVIKELPQGVLKAGATERDRLATSKPTLKRGRPSSPDKAARRMARTNQAMQRKMSAWFQERFLCVKRRLTRSARHRCLPITRGVPPWRTWREIMEHISAWSDRRCPTQTALGTRKKGRPWVNRFTGMGEP